jgi:L-threonylcarbamoyladenylate synthase
MDRDIPWFDAALDEEAAIHRAGAELAAGGVVIAPTETVYGLMCRWDCSAARERIFRMKRRTAEKPLQMLAAGLEPALRAGVVADERLRRLAAAFWPGPLTVVAPSLGGGTIGLRVPRHGLVLALLRFLGQPLAATSANLSGQAPALDAQAAVAGLAELPDLVLDGGPVPPGGGCPSTVVELAAAGVVRVLREGPIGEGELRRALGAVGEGPGVV